MDKDRKHFAAHLQAKAVGIKSAIERMNNSERSTQPSELFGKDYNSLICATKQEMPALSALLPPEVEFYDNDYIKYSNATFAEIMSYCSQVNELLAAWLKDGR